MKAWLALECTWSLKVVTDTNCWVECEFHWVRLLLQESVTRRKTMKWQEAKSVRMWESEGLQRCKKEDTVRTSKIEKSRKMVSVWERMIVKEKVMEIKRMKVNKFNLNCLLFKGWHLDGWMVWMECWKTLKLGIIFFV